MKSRSLQIAAPVLSGGPGLSSGTAVRAWFIVALIAVAMAAPCPGQQNEEPSRDPYDFLMLGKRAVEQGRHREAAEQFRQALVHDPGSGEIVALILSNLEGDGDARALWSHAWFATAVDVQGKAATDRGIRDLLSPEDPYPEKIAAARAKAVAQLVAFAEERERKGFKSPEELLVARWAKCLALELCDASPPLKAAWLRELDPGLAVTPTFHGPVIKALEQAMKNALASSDTDTALRAARILHGLGVQAAFKDLKGERPKGMGRVREMAASGMARARAQLGTRTGEPWTVNQLMGLTKEQGEAFTREHGSFAKPGVAYSPNERYRVETDCGYETLLGVALTVEDHHERLASWFGQDPFEGRQGLVRIVPEASGLEAEGTPFWWAGGFQSGDITVLRFSCGRIEGLGHGITHELTHRFDGAVYPGIPGWLAEGRAVWTGGAYGSSSDRQFVPNHASFGTIEGTLIKGYGSLHKLTELIEGTMEDYRDNYVAGYGLWMYLSTWEEGGRKIYAGELEKYMKGCAKNRNDPKGWFVRNFADGKEGRPDGLEAFAEAFHTFISGFYWKNRQPWTQRYTQRVPPAPGEPYVYDEPTWTWARDRAEPFFGQEQARLAGDLLLELGKTREAVRAFVWALWADGSTPSTEALLFKALTQKNLRDAAWVTEHLLAFPYSPTRKQAPFLNALSSVRQLIRFQEEAAAFYTGRGLAFAEAVITADRNRLAAWSGLLPLETPPSREGEVLHPFNENPRHAGLRGWQDADLTGYEEHRRKDLWYVTKSGDLHVGRKMPRKATGLLDRSAHLHHVFALGGAWQTPGTYRIKTRIRFTTSYVAGALVFGYSRRDLNLRFQFSAGDLMYAIGETEEEPAFDCVHWRLHGLRIRDGALPGSVGAGSFAFERPLPAFELELLVEGATVHAFINGSRVGTYHTVDGAPIEGYVGFAASYGAYRVQRPVVERLDRTHHGHPERGLPVGLDLARPTSRPFKELANHPVQGLPPSPNGAVLIWIPMPWLAEGEDLDPEYVLSQAERAAEKVGGLMERERSPQPFFLALPAELGEERIEAMSKKLAEGPGRKPRIVTHPFPASVATPDPVTADGNRRWILFVDSAGVIRVVLPLVSQILQSEFDDHLAHWLTVFRDHGRPPRELPEYGRLGGNPEDEEGEE